MLKCCLTLAVVASVLALTPLRAQTIAPVAVTNRSASSQSITVRIEPEPSHVSAKPFVIIGGLAGAGAVTAFWVYEIAANVRDGGDGMIFPPIIYVSVGAGAVVGGLLGWVVYDGVTHP